MFPSPLIGMSWSQAYGFDFINGFHKLLKKKKIVSAPNEYNEQNNVTQIVNEI